MIITDYAYQYAPSEPCRLLSLAF